MFELNLPNVLTLLRILLVPVLVAALVQEGGGGDTLAAVVFVLASITDALDGWIARRQKSVSTFGKLMDPLADKLLVTAALVSLTRAVGLDRKLFRDLPKDQVKRRLKEIGEAGWASAATKRAIEETQAAVITATTTAAVIITTTS